MLISSLDFALRSATVAMLLFLAARVWRDFGAAWSGRVTSAFALGSVFYAIASAAGFSAQPLWLRAPIIALSTGDIFVFWIFTRVLFDEEFRPDWRHFIGWLGLTGVSLANCTFLAGIAPNAAWLTGTALELASLVFIALALAHTVGNWTSDLVESRRRLRLFIVVAAAVHGGLFNVLRLTSMGAEPAPWMSAVNALTLAAIVAIVLWSLTRAANADLFAVEQRVPPPAPQSGIAPAAADMKLMEQLRREMAEGRLYRDEGLTIGALALRLKVPEYRLRQLINRTLGYRNFKTFLNAHRIEEAKSALADPAQRDVPITTIALDAGFQSLGPFNRAFKTQTGLTPSEFRREQAPPA
ncbi:MAG: AraC family transcriptional regulator [Alphaproteobacteria bacterium]|nr:AraC family transcriptional regulator [Alphaproteobacteria bacterium]